MSGARGLSGASETTLCGPPGNSRLLSVTTSLLPGRETQLSQIAKPLADVFRKVAAAADASGQLSGEGVRALKASGYPGLTVPERLGGFGASLYEFSLAQEILGQSDASLALVAAMNAHLLGSVGEAGSWPTEIYGELARASVGHGHLSNSLASEPELGSPSRGGLPATRAERVPGGWRLTGLKTWSTGSRALDFLVVTAAVDDREVRRFVIPAGSEGVEVRPTWQGSLGLRASGSDDVAFQEVFVPERYALPVAAPLSPVQAASSSGWFWTAVAATYLGVGQAALDSLAAYAGDRVPTALGEPISTLPKIQQAAGQMSLELLAARTLLHDVTRQWATPALRPALLPKLAAAKLLCTNAAVSVSDLALRAAGGAALTTALPLERYFRDARAGLTHPPADEQTLTLLGRRALGLD